MDINVTNAYLQNFIENYKTKTETEETNEVSENSKIISEEKNDSDKLKEILDTYSKGKSSTSKYLDYGNITKVSDIIADDLDTTLLNTKKMIYGTHNTLLNSLSGSKGSKSGIFGNEEPEDMIEKVTQKLRSMDK